MAEVNTLITQAKKAYASKDKDTARDLLLKAIDLDDRSEQAWMLMSAVAGSLNEQQICLENVLKINPNNAKAQQALAKVKDKLGSSAAPPPPQRPETTPLPETPLRSNKPRNSDDELFAGLDFSSDPFGSAAASPGFGNDSPNTTPIPGPSPVQDAPFGGGDAFGGDPFGAGDSDPFGADPFGSGSDDPFGASAASSSSVDWGDGSAPAYGSGQEVDQLSTDEYDDWISGMGLGSNSPPATPAASAPAANDPFGGADPFGSDAFGGGDPFGVSGGDDDPWGAGGVSSGASAPAASAPAANDPFGTSSDPFGGVDPFSSSGEDIWSSGATPDPYGRDSLPVDDSPFESTSAAASPAPSSRRNDDPAFAAEVDFGSADSFVFDEDGNFFDDNDDDDDDAFFDQLEDDGSDPFVEVNAAAVAPQAEKQGKKAKAEKPKKQKQKQPKTLPPAYQAIPEELLQGGAPDMRMVAVVGVLVVLNVLALIGVVVL